MKRKPRQMIPLLYETPQFPSKIVTTPYTQLRHSSKTIQITVITVSFAIINHIINADKTFRSP